MKTIVKKSALFWIPLTFIGVLNGIFRGLVLDKAFNQFEAHQASSILMVIWVITYTTYVYPKLEISKFSDSITVGSIWLFLTVAFEFVMGGISKIPVQQMVADYNLMAGRLWSLVLVTLFICPVLLFLENSYSKRMIHH